MIKKDNLITELNTMLDDKKRLTVESVIFSENEEDMPDYNEEIDNVGREDFEEEEPVMDEPEMASEGSSIEGDVNKIRKICLTAITRLADNPRSPEYDLMKKIWNLCDNTVKEKKENNN